MEPWIPRTRLVLRLRRSGTEPADDRELKGRLLGVWQNSAAEPEYQYKSDPSHVALRRRYDHAKRRSKRITLRGDFGASERSCNLAVPRCPAHGRARHQCPLRVQTVWKRADLVK